MLYKPLHRQQAQPRDQRPERHQPKQVCLLPLTSLDILCSALLVCFPQKDWGQLPDTLAVQGRQHMAGATFTCSWQRDRHSISSCSWGEGCSTAGPCRHSWTVCCWTSRCLLPQDAFIFCPCIVATEQSQSHSGTPSDGSFSSPSVQTSSSEERFLWALPAPQRVWRVPAVKSRTLLEPAHVQSWLGCQALHTGPEAVRQDTKLGLGQMGTSHCLFLVVLWVC